MNVGAVERITCRFSFTFNEIRNFIEKTTGIWKGSATHVLVGRITCECATTCEPKIHFTRENARKVNPRNEPGFLRGDFSVEKASVPLFLACDTGGNIAVCLVIQNSNENMVLQKDILFFE